MKETENKEENRFAFLGSLSKKGLSRAKETLIQSTQTVKVRIDLNILRKEKENLFLELGESLFSAIKSDSLDTTMFNDTIANIDEIKNKINNKTDELERIKVASQQEEKVEEVAVEEKVDVTAKKIVSVEIEKKIDEPSKESSPETIDDKEADIIDINSAILTEEPFAVTIEELLSEAEEKNLKPEKKEKAQKKTKTVIKEQ